MESRVNYTLVGLFIVLLGAGVVFVAFWLGAGGTTGDFKPYLIYMNEQVSGLSVQAPVKYNGVNVGYVKDISLNLNNPQQVRVLLDIKAGVPITTSTTATLMSQGITGIAYIGLKTTSSSAPLLHVTTGEKYPVIKTRPSLFTEVDTVIRELSANVNTITKSINQILNNTNQQALTASLTNLQKFTQTLADNNARIDASLKYSNRFLYNASLASEHLPETMKKLNQAITKMDRTAGVLEKAGIQADKSMHEVQIVLHGISQQALPAAIGSLQSFGQAAESFKNLSFEIRQNPSVLLRGKAHANKDPGEK